MPTLLLSLILTVLASAVQANLCEDAFRAGRAAFNAHATQVRDIRGQVYGAGGWVSTARVIDRLERRSEQTTACQELVIFTDRFDALHAPLQTARRQFQTASIHCFGINRDRARENLETLDVIIRQHTEESGFLRDVLRECRRSGPGAPGS